MEQSIKKHPELVWFAERLKVLVPQVSNAIMPWAYSLQWLAKKLEEVLKQQTLPNEFQEQVQNTSVALRSLYAPINFMQEKEIFVNTYLIPLQKSVMLLIPE